MGLGDRLIAVTHECDFPPAARTKPPVTASALPTDLQPNSSDVRTGARSAAIDRHVRAEVHSGSSLYALDERLLDQLRPDLILTQELCAVCAVSYEIVARAARRFRGDPRIVSLEPSSLEDVFANIVTVGELTETSLQAATVVGELRARCTRIATDVAAIAPPRTLVLEWTDPPMSGGHWTPGLIELAGGTPILAHAGANSQRLAWDAIRQADPDVVIVAPCGYDLATTRGAIAALAAVPAWRELRALRAGRIYAVDGNAFVNRPGPRLVDSAALFAHAIAGRPLEAHLAGSGAIAPITR